jgi:hypothetical protein
LGLAARKHAAPLLLALFDAPSAAVLSHSNSSSNSSSSDEPQQLLVLQVLTTLANLKRGGVRYLLCRVGVVAWARLVLSRDSDYTNTNSSSTKRAGGTAASVFQQQSLLSSAVKASLLTLLTELLTAGLALRTRPSLLLEEYLLLAPAVARCALNAPVTAATATTAAASARNISSTYGGTDASSGSGAGGSKRARAAAAAGPALVCAAVQLLADTAQAAAAAAVQHSNSSSDVSSFTSGVPTAQLQLPLSTVRALTAVVTRTAAPAAIAALLSLICCPGAVQAHGSASDAVAVLQWCLAHINSSSNNSGSSSSSSSSGRVSAQQVAGLLQLLHTMLTSEATSGNDVASALAADATLMRAIMALPLSATDTSTDTTTAAADTVDASSSGAAVASQTVTQGELCMLTVHVAVLVCGASPLLDDNSTQQQQLTAVAAAVNSTLFTQHSDSSSSSCSSGSVKSVQTTAEAWRATAAWSCMRRLMLHSSSSSTSDSYSVQSVVEIFAAVPPAVANDALVQSLVASLQTALAVGSAHEGAATVVAQPQSQTGSKRKLLVVAVNGSKSAAKKRKSVSG